MKWIDTHLSAVLATSDSGVWGDEDNENGVSVIRSTNMENDGRIDFSNLTFRHVPYDKRRTKLLRRGDIILENSGGGPKQPVGRVCYFEGDDQDHVVGNFCRRLRAKNGLVNPRYLFWHLFYAHASGDTLRFQTQTTGIRNLKFKAYADQPLALPALSEQTRIVELLDEADRLRKLRREADAKAARILPALFLKMFGDPVANPKGWPLTSVGDLTTLVTSGSTPRGGAEVYVNEGPYIIRSQNVLMNRLNLSDAAHITDEMHLQMSRTWVSVGDVLLNITGASIGRVAWVKELDAPANVNQHVCIIRPDSKLVNSAYLSASLSLPSMQATIDGVQTGASRQALNHVQVRNLKVPNPPVVLQSNFALHANSVEKFLEQGDFATGKLDALWKTLMQRAFSGQLTAKWREAHMKELLTEMQQQARALNLPMPKELEAAT